MSLGSCTDTLRTPTLQSSSIAYTLNGKSFEKKGSLDAAISYMAIALLNGKEGRIKGDIIEKVCERMKLFRELDFKNPVITDIILSRHVLFIECEDSVFRSSLCPRNVGCEGASSVWQNKGPVSIEQFKELLMCDAELCEDEWMKYLNNVVSPADQEEKRPKESEQVK